MKEEMTLKEIQKYQKGFDEKYFKVFWKGKEKGGIDWKLYMLNYMTIALTGELGEFANIMKKINREKDTLGEYPDEKEFEDLKEELTDCFIYLIILSNILEMDLEKEFIKKLRFNEQRFQKYLK